MNDPYQSFIVEIVFKEQAWGKENTILSKIVKQIEKNLERKTWSEGMSGEMHKGVINDNLAEISYHGMTKHLSGCGKRHIIDTGIICVRTISSYILDDFIVSYIKRIILKQANDVICNLRVFKTNETMSRC